MNSRFLLALLIVFLSCSGILSCQTETKDDKKVERNAAVDSAITAFQKNLLKNQLDALISEKKFNGILSIKISPLK
ncbi:hypothetical protein [Bergeyella sp. RCAD1439]|uniref:hypothetical protein n=1 Tax=Bergeyella anatis TaxID=3113737 RepID=UPI002E195F1D|nr:hypothetical protein [Bergeyella sp. RCAD1439]